MRKNRHMEWNGLSVTGDIVDDDCTSDLQCTVPYAPYVQDLKIMFKSHDLTSAFTDEGLAWFGSMLIEHCNSASNSEGSE